MVMRKIIPILFAILSASTFASENERIAIDEGHNQRNFQKGKSGKYYAIKPSSSLEVDFSEYQFKKIKGKNINFPNRLHLYFGPNREHSLVVMPGLRKYYLNSSTLSSETEGFAGFKSGDTVIMTLEYIGKGKRKYDVMWAGALKVKK